MKTQAEALIVLTLLGLFAPPTRSQTDFWQHAGLDSIGVHSLVFQKGVLFAATQGAIYATTDQGVSWSHRDVGLDRSVLVTSLASSPRGFLFAGTKGRGVYRSSDIGITWSQFNNGLDPTSIDCMFADDSGYVFAAGGNVPGARVYRSTDDAQHWTLSRLGDSSYGYVGAFAMDSSQRLMAGAYWYNIYDEVIFAKLFLSTDHGSTWPQNTPFIDAGEVTAIAVAPDKSIYTGLSQGSGLYYSRDSGLSWTRIIKYEYITSLAVNLKGYIYAGSITAGGIGGVFCSIDSGKTWRSVNSGLKDNNVYCLTLSAEQFLFAGTDSAGVYRSKQNTTTLIQQNRDLILSTYLLYQNYPNPFNPSTTIAFDLPTNEHVRLVVFDVLGRQVAAITNQYFTQGHHSISWDASNLSSGVYFYRLESKAYTKTKKLILLQ